MPPYFPGRLSAIQINQSKFKTWDVIFSQENLIFLIRHNPPIWKEKQSIIIKLKRRNRLFI